MKKANLDELRPEYRRGDLGPGVRGKYLGILSLRDKFGPTSPRRCESISHGRSRKQCSSVIY